MPALCILTVCFTQNNESAFRRHDVVYEHTKVKVCKQSTLWKHYQKALKSSETVVASERSTIV